MIKSGSVGLLLGVLTVAGLAGCASVGERLIPDWVGARQTENPDPAAGDRIGIVSREPQSNPMPASSSTIKKRWALGGTAAGGAGGLGAGLAVGLAACSPSIIFPAAYPICVALTAATGAAAGALGGTVVGSEVGKQAASLQQSQQSTAPSTDFVHSSLGPSLQDRLREQVVSAAHTEGKQVVDLGRRRAGDDTTTEDVDRVLELTLLSATKQPRGDDSYRVVLKAESVFVSPGDGSEDRALTHDYVSEPIIIDPTVLTDTQFPQGYELAVDTLAREIVSARLRKHVVTSTNRFSMSGSPSRAESPDTASKSPSFFSRISEIWRGSGASTTPTTFRDNGNFR